MGRRIVPVPGRFFGLGEQSAAAPGLADPGQSRILRGGVLSGPGTILQQPDFLLADTAKNASAAENHVVCGIFPFQTQGGASAASEAIWISLDATNNVLRLHQVGEAHTILRSFDVPGTYSELVPPQITGFEMFGKFYFVDYGNVLAASRLGMVVFDPASTGSITRPTYELIAGGTGAAALRFRGICKHRGAVILGWGYDEEGSVEGAHILRSSKYGLPDTWVPDTDEISAFRGAIGTVNVPIIGCAESDQFTIIGKETEIFVLDGDYSSQFYARRIGNAHGPVSTVGICTYGDGAMWMSAQGPARSVRGGPVELMGLDQLVRRMLNYVDLSKVCAAYDADNHRVVFSVRPRLDDDAAPIEQTWPTELLFWDTKRDDFYVCSTPTTVFCVGVVKGPGVNLPGPTGVVSSITATQVTQASAKIAWTAGDTAPDVQFEVQFRVHATTDYLAGGITGTQIANLTLTGLAASTVYDVRVRQVRNTQVSNWVESLSLVTTADPPTALDPPDELTGLTAIQASYFPPTRAYIEMHWTPYLGGDDFVVDLLVGRDTNGVSGATDPNDDAALFQTVGAGILASAGAYSDPTAYPIGIATGLGPTVYVWGRVRSLSTGFAGDWVDAASNGLDLTAWA